jgi:hypothetical protein
MSAAPERVLSGEDLRTAIVSVVHDADRFVVLASPYLEIAEWTDLLDAVKSAASRGVEVHLVTRPPSGSPATREAHGREVELLASMGARVSSVFRLHAKMYISEKWAVLTSLNLLTSSSRSVDFGLLTASRIARSQALRLLIEHVPSLVHLSRAPSPKRQRGRARARGDSPAPVARSAMSPTATAVADCAHCRGVWVEPSDGECALCVEWGRRTDREVLGLAMQIANLARQGTGTRLRVWPREHYVGLRAASEGSYPFRLIPRTRTVEVRLRVIAPDRWLAKLRSAGINAEAHGSEISVVVDAVMLRENELGLRSVFAAVRD